MGKKKNINKRSNIKPILGRTPERGYVKTSPLVLQVLNMVMDDVSKKR